jgi:hypothetical protein
MNGQVRQSLSQSLSLPLRSQYPDFTHFNVCFNITYLIFMIIYIFTLTAYIASALCRW